MRNRASWVFVLVLLLVPMQAFAVICFTATDTTRSAWNIELTVEGGAEGFFNLIGEGFPATDCPTQSAPLNGAAHLRSDGKAHFNVIIGATSGACFTTFIQGVLNPPAFNTGSGTVEIPKVGVFDTVTITSLSPCPSITQSPAGDNPR